MWHTMTTDFYTVGKTGYATVLGGNKKKIKALDQLANKGGVAAGQFAEVFFAAGIALGRFHTDNDLLDYIQTAPPSTTATTLPPPTTTTTSPPTATFACSGTAPEGVDITYGSDTQNISGGHAVPWSASLPVPSGAQDESVSAQLQGPDGSISCSVAVTVDGTTTSQTGEAVGDYNIAQAEVCNADGWQTC
jgi:hypothetical protein